MDFLYEIMNTYEYDKMKEKAIGVLVMSIDPSQNHKLNKKPSGKS